MKINPKFKKVAIRVAKEAGKILKKNFKRHIKIRAKEDLSLVTNVDLWAERIIKKTIKRNFPTHSIIGEETGGRFGKEFTWVIDPLDGTTNYILGFPFFCVAIALLKKEEPILGLVFNPILKELYFAEKGKGAYLNQKKIKVNKVNNLARSLILFNKGKDLRDGLRFIIKIVSRIRTTRFWGSSHLEICQIAAGKIEGYLTSKPAYYDNIAGAFIIEESGGKVTDFSGLKYTRNSKNLIITNGKIHNQLLKLIKTIK